MKKLWFALFSTGEGSSGGGSGEGTPPAGNAGTPPAGEAGKGAAGDPTAPAAGTDKLSYLEEKVDSLNKALNSERAEVKKLKAERDEYAGKVGAFELKEKKALAFDEALAGLGDDYDLPADKLPKVKEFLAKLPDSETLADEVKGFVDLVKASKAKPEDKLPTAPFFGTPPAAGSNKEASQMTDAEKLELAHKDPEKFTKLFLNPIK